MEEPIIMNLAYIINEESVIVSGIKIYDDEHLIVTIFAPGQDGFTVEREKI